MEVRAHRLACHADIADDRAPPHVLARLDGEGTQMAIDRRDAVSVAEGDVLAQELILDNFQGQTVRRGDDGIALSGGDVEPGMERPFAGEGVGAVTEGRG
jgi:hypothetical protein